MPVGHAMNNVHTFYLGSSTVGACSGKCEGLNTSAGSDDTTTTQSVVIGSSPTLDANANAKRTGSWVSGTTYTVTSFSTTSAVDTIFAITTVNGLTITESKPSTPGVTWDAAARATLAPAGCLASMTEWVGHTTGTLSAVTTTITLSGTPTGSSTEIIAFNGAEDPSGAFSPSDKAAGFSNSGSQCTSSASTPVATSTTTLNANDMIIGFFGDQNSMTETAGAGFTLDLTVATGCATGPGCSLAIEHKSVTATEADTCPFGATDNRWLVLCDAIQSAPKYYVVEPDIGATTLTATPSTSTPTGYGWIYDTSGLQAKAISDVQSGTWQIDQTIGLSAINGAPVARLWVTVWSCTTHSLGTCTFLFKNWDTGTINVAGQIAATKNTYTTASQASFVTPAFLSVEYFLVWQYSGNTAAVTVTHTTVSAKSDIITPGWDTTQSLTASLQMSAVLTRLSNIFKSLSGSLGSASSFVEKTSIFKAIAASITLTMGNMVANVNSGQLTCNSNPRSCSTTLTATWTMTSGFAEKASLFRSLGGSLSLAGSLFRGRAQFLNASLGSASSFAEKSLMFRSLSGSLGFAGSQVKDLAKALSVSLGSASSFTEKSSLFRSLTDSLGFVASQAKDLAKALSASFGQSSSFAEKTSLFRSLIGSLGLVASETKSLARVLTGSLALVSSFAEKSSLFRSLTGSLVWTSSIAEKSSLFRSLTDSLSSASGFAGKNSLFRSLTGSLSLVASEAKGLAKTLSGTLGSSSSFAEKSSLFRTLSGSWTTAPGSGEKSSFFRSLAGSLSVAGSEAKGLARALNASLNSVSSFAEKSSLFRSLTGSLSSASGFARKNSLFRSLVSSLSSASGFAEKSSLFRSLSASLTISSFEAQVSNLIHSFYYGSTSQPGCAIKCEQLVTTAGPADTTTSVKVGSSTTCCFEVVPDVSSSIATATPSTSTPTGQAWVYPTDLGGITIQSGPWRFDTTIQASRTGTATMRFLVWSCLTASEGNCTLLYDFTGTANIESTTTGPIQYTDATPTVGPFSNVHYLTVEVWISPTGTTGNGGATDTMTTVSTASDVITPAWSYSQSLTGTLNLASSLAEKSSLFRSLTGSLSRASSLFAGRTVTLSGSLGSSPSFSEKSSLFRSLTSSLSLAASENKGLTKALSASLGSASSFIEHTSLVRSLTGALGSASSLVERSSLFRSLTGSLSAVSSFAEHTSFFRSLTSSLGLPSSLLSGRAVTLSISIGSASGFAEHTSTFRSLTGALGSSSMLVEHTSLFRSLSA